MYHIINIIKRLTTRTPARRRYLCLTQYHIITHATYLQLSLRCEIVTPAYTIKNVRIKTYKTTYIGLLMCSIFENKYCHTTIYTYNNY